MSQHFDGVKVNVHISYAYSEDNSIIKDIFVRYNDGNSFYLNDLMDDIISKGNNLVANSAISYYDNDLKTYMYCGIHPFNCNISIPINKNETNV